MQRIKEKVRYISKVYTLMFVGFVKLTVSRTLGVMVEINSAGWLHPAP